MIILKPVIKVPCDCTGRQEELAYLKKKKIVVVREFSLHAPRCAACLSGIIAPHALLLQSPGEELRHREGGAQLVQVLVSSVAEL